MIRPFTCLCLLFAAGSGLFLYNSKHGAQMLDQEIARTNKSAQESRARAALLRAEYDRLGDPERLKELANQVLPSLASTDPKQFASLTDLEKRLPAVAPPPVLVPETQPVATPATDQPPVATTIPAIAAASPSDKPAIERPAPQALAMIARPVQPARPVTPVAPSQPTPLMGQAQAAITPPAAAVSTAPKPAPVHPVTETKPAPQRPPVTPQAAPSTAVAANTVLTHPRPVAPMPTSTPPQASEMVARLVRNVPSDTPAPMVASALGMARTMMQQQPAARP